MATYNTILDAVDWRSGEFEVVTEAIADAHNQLEEHLYADVRPADVSVDAGDNVSDAWRHADSYWTTCKPKDDSITLENWLRHDNQLVRVSKTLTDRLHGRSLSMAVSHINDRQLLRSQRERRAYKLADLTRGISTIAVDYFEGDELRDAASPDDEFFQKLRRAAT